MAERGTACLLGAILLLSGCAADSDNGADTAGEGSPSSIEPSSSVPLASGSVASSSVPLASGSVPSSGVASDTAPSPTGAPERHAEAPLLFDLVVADAAWNPGAERSPLLATLRSGPGGDYGVATMITVPRRVMEGTGAVRTDDSGVAWRELHLWLGRTGWVEADRLEINLAAQTSYFDDPCATDGVIEGQAPITGPTSAGGGGPRADHVAQMWHLVGPGCDRLHIALGTAWDYDSGGELAAGVPEEVTVEAFGSWARITVAGLDAARLDAGVEQGWNLTSVVARAAGGMVVIDVHAPQLSRFAARALRNPARLLVDAIPAVDAIPVVDGASESQLPAALQLHSNGSVFVAWPGRLDADSPTEVALPLTVRGYSRWFEAAGDVEIEHADGTPAVATVTGPRVFNPGANSQWHLTATDWSEVWGTFEFTMDDLDPGEYRLRVGEYPPTGESDFVGVTIPVRVPPP